MKKIIISLITLISLTGCWNYKELNQYAIVSGVAIDKDDDKYEVSVLISNSPKNNSNDKNSSESQVVVYSGKGKSIFDAIKSIGLISPKQLYFGSFSILILSEEVAKDGITHTIDFFVRDPASRKNFYIALSKDVKAKDTLKTLSPLTTFPSQNITDNIKSTNNLQGIIDATNFDEILTTILSNGSELAINCVEIIGDEKKGSKKDNLESSEPLSYIKLGNLGIFKDDKLVDWASHDESVGINMINNNISEMYLDLKLNDSYVVVDSTHFSSKIKVDLKNNKPIVNIYLSGEARIIEVDGNLNLKDEQVIKNLEKLSNKSIKKKVNQAINLAIQNKTDIFGFGNFFYKKYPKYFKSVRKDWNNNLDNIDINIKSHFVLKNKVSSKTSLEEIHE